MEVLNLTEGKKLLLVDVKEIPPGIYIDDYLKLLNKYLRLNGISNTLTGVHDSKHGTKKSRISRKLKKCIQESYKKLVEYEKNKMDCRSEE